MLYLCEYCNKNYSNKYTLNKQKCCHKTCRYAHSIVELNIIECSYGSRCKAVRFNSSTCKYFNDTRKDKVCMRIHPEETKVNFYSRVNKSIPLSSEEMDLVYNCIEEFETKNIDLVNSFVEKASKLPSNKSIEYIIPTPFYDVHAYQYGILPPIEEVKKVKEVKEVKKVKKFKVNTVVYKQKETDESKKLTRITKIGTQIQDLKEKIKKNNNIFERFSSRIDNIACQKHCEQIKLENDKSNSTIIDLDEQIKKIKKEIQVAKEKEKEIQVVVEKKEIQVVKEIIMIEKK